MDDEEEGFENLLIRLIQKVTDQGREISELKAALEAERVRANEVEYLIEGLLLWMQQSFGILIRSHTPQESFAADEAESNIQAALFRTFRTLKTGLRGDAEPMMSQVGFDRLYKFY